jgi:hypothetical protein
VEAPLADLMASGGIPEGSKVLVSYTGVDKHGEALDFFFEAAPELIQQAQELRAAEVGRSSNDGPQQPSVGLSTEGGKVAEHSAGPLGIRGPRVTPRRGTDLDRG